MTFSFFDLAMAYANLLIRTTLSVRDLIGAANSFESGMTFTALTRSCVDMVVVGLICSALFLRTSMWLM